MKNIQYYILFKNHDNGLKLYNSLKEIKIKSIIAPTPRSLSKCCGISLMIDEKDIPKIKECISDKNIEIIDILKIEKDISSNRDKYC